MKKKPLYIGGSVLVLAVLAAGAYFISGRNLSSDLSAQKDKLQSALVVAKNKLSNEKEKLAGMTAAYRDAHPLGVSSQEQMKKTSVLVLQTNFMFAGATGSNPEFLAKNPFSNIDINAERKNVNALIAAWAKEADLSSLEKLDRGRAERLRQEIQVVRQYIEHLNQIVHSFTPQNSGLSQLQIDNYMAQLPTMEAIDEILASLDASIQNSTESGGSPSGESGVPSAFPAGETGVETNTQTNTSGGNGPENNSGSSTTVTTGDVAHQEQAVAQAEAEVEAAEEELAELQEQIDQSSGEPVPPEVPVASDPEEQNGNGGSSDASANDPYHGLDKYKGIIVQPGPPQLIQGSNQY